MDRYENEVLPAPGNRGKSPTLPRHSQLRDQMTTSARRLQSDSQEEKSEMIVDLVRIQEEEQSGNISRRLRKLSLREE